MDWGIWNTTFADLVCQNLGYSSSLALESIPKPEGFAKKMSYKLNTPLFSTKQNRLLQFKKTDDGCDQFASIACQEYGKYLQT